jgi:hypothetical protein
MRSGFPSVGDRNNIFTFLALTAEYAKNSSSRIRDRGTFGAGLSG